MEKQEMRNQVSLGMRASPTAESNQSDVSIEHRQGPLHGYLPMHNITDRDFPVFHAAL